MKNVILASAFAVLLLTTQAAQAQPLVHHAIMHQKVSDQGKQGYSTYHYEGQGDADFASLVQVRELRDALASLSAHGMPSAHYLSRLQAIDEGDKQALGVLLRDVLYDLRYGTTRNQSHLSPQASAALYQAMQQCADAVACFQHIAARHAQYVPLQLTLDQYRSIAQNGGWSKVPAGRALKRGQTSPRVAVLRQRLQVTGDYRGGAVEQGDQYDASLEEGVTHFQARHGLKADGVVGAATLAALNVPVQKRIEQLALSLERLRKLPNASAQRYVRVNIPSYQLTAYDGERTLLKMDVVVGKKSRPTPEFNNEITTVGLNPTWTPTTKILQKDLLPKFRNNPDYVRRAGFSVRDRITGEMLDPWLVDWHTVSARDVMVVQQSGRSNALGKVKFLLPNNESIYLHDTSHPELFAKDMRALSSGCVRLQDPKAFLDYVVASQSSQRFAKLKSYYAGSARKHISLDQPIPVQTTYFTAWVNDVGEVSFYKDIYHKDDRLQLAMSKDARQFAAR